MSRNIDRWVRAMRDDVAGLANRQQQPTAAEVRAAREIRRNAAFRQIVADLRKLNPDAELPQLPAEGPSEQELQQAEALLRQVDPPAPSDTREQFMAQLQQIAEAQKQAELLREDLEARRKAIVEQRAKTPKLELVKDSTEPAKSTEQKPREPSHGPPMVGPGWVSVSPRQSSWWHLYRRAPGH